MLRLGELVGGGKGALTQGFLASAVDTISPHCPLHRDVQVALGSVTGQSGCSLSSL